MSDAALVLRVRGGDEAAFEELARRYRGYIRLRGKTYFLQGAELEDLIQEGLFGLHKAVRDYRADRGSGFRNFAEMCISRQVVTAVKTATRRKHLPLNEALSLRQTPKPSSGGKESTATLEEMLTGPDASDPLEHLCQREELGAFLDGLSRLTELERLAILGIGEGRSYAELSSATGYSYKQIDNAAQRARLKLGQVLETAA